MEIQFMIEDKLKECMDKIFAGYKRMPVEELYELRGCILAYEYTLKIIKENLQ